MRFIWFVFVVAFIGWMIERAVRRGVLSATKVNDAATKLNDAALERSIRSGRGEDVNEIDGFVVGVRVVLWLFGLGMIAWVVWNIPDRLWWVQFLGAFVVTLLAIFVVLNLLKFLRR